MGFRWLLALALVATALYAGNLADPFLGDDFDLIRSFHDKPFGYFPALLWSNESGDVWRAWGIDPEQGRGYLRPLKIWLLALDRALFGLDPRGFHATATAGFVAAVCLAAALAARALPGRPALAAAGAATAAAHPVLAEVVPFVTAREETFGIAFGLAALLAFVRHREDGRSPFAFAGWLALALGVKESSLAFVALAAGWDLVHGRLAVRSASALRTWARPWWPAAALLAGYFGLRWIAFGNFVGGDGEETHFGSPSSLLYYGHFFRSLGDPTLLWVGAWPAAALGVAALALAPLAGVALRWRRVPPARRRDLLFFGPVWLLASTVLYTGIYFSTRHHVLPVIGLALFEAVALAAWLEAGAPRGERRAAAALAAAAALLFLPSSLATSLEYREASRTVENVRREIEARAADAPDGSRILVSNVPQLTMPPFYFGWGFLSALRAPFSPSDLAGRALVVNPRNRELTRSTEPVPESFDLEIDVWPIGRIAAWIAARHNQRVERDLGIDIPDAMLRRGGREPAGPRAR